MNTMNLAAIIAISHLNTRQATIRMLRGYRNQQWKAKHEKERIDAIQSRLESVTAKIGGEHVSGGGGNHAEDALVAGIDQKAMAEYGYLWATAYIALMDTCLSRLTDQERRVLELRFIDYLEGNGVNRVMDEYHVSRSEVYRMTDDAVDKLASLIYPWAYANPGKNPGK